MLLDPTLRVALHRVSGFAEAEAETYKLYLSGASNSIALIALLMHDTFFKYSP